MFVAVKSPDNYVWGYSAPYKWLVKTANGVDVVENGTVVKSVPVDDIKNLEFSNEYYNNDTIVSWYNYDASEGSIFTLEKGMVGFSDGRNNISSSDVPVIFGQDVVDALALMTHDKNVPYLDYVAKLTDNPIARTVKLADLAHNSDSTRLDVLDEKTKERLAKYRKAIAILDPSVQNISMDLS